MEFSGYVWTLKSMVVGILRVRLYIRSSRSLKEKRHALRKAKDKIRHHYNVAVAEIGDQDDWKSAILGITAVGNDPPTIQSVLDKVQNTLRGLHVAELLDRKIILRTFDEADFPEIGEDLKI